MAHLILVRHGQSEWNKLGKWTGYVDVGLTEKGTEEAKNAAQAISGISIQKVFTSALKRAHETYNAIRDVLGLPHEPVKHHALNERHYGVLTGKNKWEVKDEIGEEAFQKIRRGWDTSIEGGETLKDVYERVVPYFREHIIPEITSGNNVLIVAHGNSLRALVKYLEGVSDENIPLLEIATGEVYCYELDTQGVVCGKTIKNAPKVS